LALASSGVCRAGRVAPAAVRSYRTVSPLPSLVAKAVCFLWHFPADRSDWPLASTPPCEARTFLPSAHPAPTGVRPSRSGKNGYNPRSAYRKRSRPVRPRHDSSGVPSQHGQACAQSRADDVHIRSSIARLLISSAAEFISRGTCTSFTRENPLSRLSASSYSGRSDALFTWYRPPS